MHHHLGARPQLEVESVRKVAPVRVLGVVALYAATLAMHPLVAPTLRENEGEDARKRASQA